MYPFNYVFRLITIKSIGGVINMGRTITIEEAPFKCPLCVEYVKKNTTIPPKIPVVACEGGCLRGEVARRGANIITFNLSPQNTVRVCLPGIVSTGMQAELLQKADNVIIIEGCALKCGYRLLKAAIPTMKANSLIADEMYDFNRSLYGIDEMEDENIKIHAYQVAEKIVKEYLS